MKAEPPSPPNEAVVPSQLTDGRLIIPIKQAQNLTWRHLFLLCIRICDALVIDYTGDDFGAAWGPIRRHKRGPSGRLPRASPFRSISNILPSPPVKPQIVKVASGRPLVCLNCHDEIPAHEVLYHFSKHAVEAERKHGGKLPARVGKKPIPGPCPHCPRVMKRRKSLEVHIALDHPEVCAISHLTKWIDLCWMLCIHVYR